MYGRVSFSGFRHDEHSLRRVPVRTAEARRGRPVRTCPLMNHGGASVFKSRVEALLQANGASASPAPARPHTPSCSRIDSPVATAPAVAFTSRPHPTFAEPVSAGLGASPLPPTVIRALGTQHQSITCSSSRTGRADPGVDRHAKPPLPRTAFEPRFLLSHQVRESAFPTVLTGEGFAEALSGDMLFQAAGVRRAPSLPPCSASRPRPPRRHDPYLSLLHQRPQADRAFPSRPGPDHVPNLSCRPRWVLSLVTATSSSTTRVTPRPRPTLSRTWAGSGPPPSFLGPRIGNSHLRAAGPRPRPSRSQPQGVRPSGAGSDWKRH